MIKTSRSIVEILWASLCFQMHSPLNLFLGSPTNPFLLNPQISPMSPITTTHKSPFFGFLYRSSERKTSSSSTVATGGSGGHGSSEETSVKADSGHGDSDNGSLPSSPTLTCHSGRMGGHRKKLLSTSQPHLAVLSDHHLVDTSSVDAADDIIFERTRNNPRKFSGSNNNTRPTVIPPPLQFKKHSSSSTNLQQVVTGLTGLPVPGAPPGAQLQLGPPGGLLTVGE